MLRYICRRIAYSIPIAIGVSIFCFLLIHMSPGEPIDALLPEGATPEFKAELRATYGLDRPLVVQYAIWLARVATGDFGISIMTRRPVVGEVVPAVANTAILALFAIAAALILGVLAGAVAGHSEGRWPDRLISAVVIGGISVPNYWLGMVLIVIFAVELGVLPAAGMGAGGSRAFSWNLEGLRFVVLPATALAVIPLGIVARSVRATVIEIRKQDFVQTLDAKGLGRPRILLHVAKNAAPPVLAIMGLQFAHLLGGSILVETVFAWPGTGFLLNSAIFTRDLPIIQGVILVLSMFFVFTNIVVDVLQTVFDPRLQRA